MEQWRKTMETSWNIKNICGEINENHVEINQSHPKSMNAVEKSNEARIDEHKSKKQRKPCKINQHHLKSMKTRQWSMKTMEKSMNIMQKSMKAIDRIIEQMMTSALERLQHIACFRSKTPQLARKSVPDWKTNQQKAKTNCQQKSAPFRKWLGLGIFWERGKGIFQRDFEPWCWTGIPVTCY